MKVLITGATGQLGKEIINESPNEIIILTPNREELNLSDKLNCKKY